MTKDNVKNMINNKGQRITKSREQMIDVFIGNQNIHFTIEDLIEKLKFYGPVNVATVYNNVAALVEIGLIDEYNFNNKKHYELTSGFHAHFICNDCGKVFNVEIPSLDCLHIEIKRKYNASVTNKNIYFEGVCDECSQLD